MIENLFYIPIYVDEIIEKELIQEELKNIVSKCNFKYNPIYKNSHKISDTSFFENILQVHNCNYFLNELHNHIGKYLQGIGSPIDLSKEKYKVTSWITLNDRGDYTAQHNHSAADLSGVYYIQVPENSGNLFFKTPNKGLISSYCYYHLPEVCIVNAKEGIICLFPGWLDHGVLSNESIESRISLSFNITFQRKLFL
ncbi:hypothetical protein EBU95_17335 [bacterium]|nr:hypothetical protein [bacterium]